MFGESQCTFTRAPLGAPPQVSLRWSETFYLLGFYKHFAPNGAKSPTLQTVPLLVLRLLLPFPIPHAKISP